ncbi:unnamed protein product [Bemisia tabaci]|uniref:BTB domain-containing protein n=1 Tax=Bemisia tabaci TaxID=7038 RepID=A0A9P0A235_BEMTA|nr:PREDICTED: longitudinals lacking protein, isoforms H/M/V-like isoform X1 [Bemisia tabaci]XP_018913943.1 PREDICTED: longitudinals lacking protein, isoforms H/M/V-like isoform X1 [Bemisia tabaci]CAH0382777.1 unnamed protein product [Bemisia tabaci]
MSGQQFCLRWNNHQPNFVAAFSSLLNNESLVDVTLAAEGKHIQAHRIVLSACSSYFQTLLSMNACQHPIVILKDVRYKDLKTLVEYMYYGEVNVCEDQLPAILKTAETLQIKGLTEMPEEKISLNKTITLSTETPTTSPCAIRRKRFRKCSTNSGSSSMEQIPGGSEESIERVIITSPSPSSLKAESADCPSPLHSPRELSIESETKDLSSKGSFDEDRCSLSQQQSIESNDSRKSNREESRPPSCSSQASSQGTLRSVSVDSPSVASKRGRLLIRQPRIKKESDGDRDDLSPEKYNSDLGLSPGPVAAPLGNLLTVPQPSFLVKQHSHPLLFPSSAGSSSSPQLNVSSPTETTTRSSKSFEELRRTMSTPQYSTIKTEFVQEGGNRSVHCPVLRPGPALGCNFCWNTIDDHGRILRRKTKYHCPECRTNLCIVPCFQDYHEKCCSEDKAAIAMITRAQSPVPLSPGSSVPTIVKTRSV